MLEKLYCNLISDVDAYADLPETGEARNAIDAFMKKKDISCREQLQDLICDYGDWKEKQGFMNGFRCAFLLVLETFEDTIWR